MSLLILAVSTVLAYLLYNHLIYPLFFSPLSRIPAAHPIAPFSCLWILFHRLRQTDTPAVHAAHVRLRTPILRLAPNEISINCVDDGIRPIYAGGFPKGAWYSDGFSNYGVEPMFAMPDHGRHARRKRMVSHVYAKSTLLGSEAVEAITRVLVTDRLRERVREDEGTVGKEARLVEFYDVFAAVTMDFVAAYVFGLKNGTDLLRDREGSRAFLHEFKSRQRFTFWSQECPITMRVAKAMGLQWLLVPQWVGISNVKIERWLMDLCDKAEASLREDGEGRAATASEKARDEEYPSVYAQLRTALFKEYQLRRTSATATSKPAGSSSSRSITNDFTSSSLYLNLASELLDHTLAGFDTSSITLAYLAWELSRPCHRHWQTLLRAELHSAMLSPAVTSNRTTNPPLPSAKTLDTLPLLNAILMETLRLHAPIPGQQPRLVPPSSQPTVLSGFIIPPGTRVQSQAWTLHRNADVFPDPDRWDPGRWLLGEDHPDLPHHKHECDGGGGGGTTASHLAEMHRWFWAFSSGGRMCVGRHLAMLDMKAIIAGLWSVFETETAAVDGDEGKFAMRHNGGYLAEPLGDGKGAFCRLRVREVEMVAAA